MIMTVTLNPALDYLISLETLEQGAIQRFSQSAFAPGGKGVNVSLLLSSLGVENRALGLAAGFSGREICRLLEAQGCPTDFVLLEKGTSRINVKVRTPQGEETDLNGEGPQIPPEGVDRLLEKLETLEPGDFLVLAGSLPPGLPEGAYPRILETARRRDARLVVDTTGDALLAALPYRPFLIKPNAEELGQLFGVEIADVGAAKEYGLQLQRMGARNVVVSMGERGALLLEEGGRSLYCHGVRGRTVSTVGAGDSLVAGFLFGYLLHGTAEGGLRWGVAAGAATAFREGIATGDQVKAQFPAVENPHPV